MNTTLPHTTAATVPAHEPRHAEWSFSGPVPGSAPAPESAPAGPVDPLPGPSREASIFEPSPRRGQPPTAAGGSVPTSPGPAVGASYALEDAIGCPHCGEQLRTFRVIRVLRTQVSFTSTLPRKGYVIVCPQCARILSAALAGLL
jgi:hypothetical protein